MKELRITSQKCANFLMNVKGLVPIRTEDNIDNPVYKVFIFNDNSQLQTALQDFSKQKVFSRGFTI